VISRPRKKLPHGIPLWINPNEEVYFITVCCDRRAVNQLCVSNVAEMLFETVRYRNENYVWFCHVMVLMPDHLHGLFSFPPGPKTIRKRIDLWKEWVVKQADIKWQRDFFEHRLRGEQARKEKSDYILQNPVRAGLVKRAEDWPWAWFPSFDKD
jgi:putative transposase